ncbi:MAG: amidohydrolase, partial [Actinomycetota bacterium]
VGDRDAVLDLRGPSTQVLDLGSRLVLPGFQDAHVHASAGGLERIRCDLSRVHGLDDYLGVIRAYADANPGDGWILGGGWAMDVFPGGVPTRDLLDAVVPDRPVFLSNRDHHAAWVNTRALELGGVTATTPDPADGRVERDAAGEAVGTLQEGAMDLVQRVIPPNAVEEQVAGILEGQRYLHALGITAWQEAIVGDYAVTPDCYEAYLETERRGLLTGRVVGALWWERGKGLAQLDGILERRARARDGRFRATSVKIMHDGVVENGTAGMLVPYLDGHGHPTGNLGLTYFGAEELIEATVRLDREGFQCHFHAIGDRAVREVLDAIEAARAANGPNDNRHHVAHLEFVHPEDVPRFAALGATANAQALWACRESQLEQLTLPFVDPARAEWIYPFGSIVRAGAGLCAGSDWPVSEPDVLQQVHVAVNRLSPPRSTYASAHAGEEALLPEEALTLEQAIAAFTIGSAGINHLEGETGTIEVGKAADLAVLSRDVFAHPAEEIGLAEVELTMVDGAVVHRASAL